MKVNFQNFNSKFRIEYNSESRGDDCGEDDHDPTMKILADLMVFFGAILLTAGTDLVIETAGQDAASLGGLLGVLLSVIGVSILTAGILNHRGIAQRGREQALDNDMDGGRSKRR
jgi:hypothetical protein